MGMMMDISLRVIRGNNGMRNSDKIDTKATSQIRDHYQRMSPKYDQMAEGSERRYTPWRKDIWSKVKGPRILEVGVGTGRNMPYYPAGKQIIAIDLTPGMLSQAQKRATSLKLNVDLQVGDVQALEFPDNSFDTAVATFVFCSVPKPVSGLLELKRVVKPYGQILLLEHTRSPNQLLGVLMDLLNPLSIWLMGDNINRRTVENIQKAGLVIERITDLAMGGIFKQIQITVEK
jgi:phosphatidylethanolamine/phosphatidyl-N-methylethanolamine N-methyltransferase